MFVAELWRYPVKSLRGEPLERAEVRLGGIAGDRLVQVHGPNGLITARVKPRLLGLSAALDSDGAPLIDGRPWNAPESLDAVRSAAGTEARPIYDDGPGRFDDSPLLVATDGAIAAFGEDGRRLRPNIVVGGVDGLGEREWPGRELRIGEVAIRVGALCPRCVITTVDPDTLEQNPEILRRINAEFGGDLALNCSVAAPGSIRRGDPVQLV